MMELSFGQTIIVVPLMAFAPGEICQLLTDSEVKRPIITNTGNVTLSRQDPFTEQT